MQGLRYLEDAVTLNLDAEKCTGCAVCTVVCPHGVFAIGADKRATIVDRGACMECGACALNCAWGAISVKPGVGCAEAIIHSWIYGGEPTCGCSAPDAAGAGAGSSCCGSGASATDATTPTTAAPAARDLSRGAGSSCGCGSAADDGTGPASGAS